MGRRSNSKCIKGVASPLRRHTFEQKVCLLREQSMVFVTSLALTKMWHFVDIAQGEVGWLGTVLELAEGGFLIEDVYLLEQEVSSTTTEIAPAGLSALTQELLREPEGLDRVNRLRFWGHSHGQMGTSPSGQDDSQTMEFAGVAPWFLRAILNKHGRMEMAIFLFQLGIKIIDAEWAELCVIDNMLRDSIEREFAAKVRSKVFSIGLGQFHHPTYSLGGGLDFASRFALTEEDAIILGEAPRGKK